MNARIEAIVRGDFSGLTFTRCSACGETGTWDESGLCPGCEKAITESAGRKDRASAWARSLAELEVPPKYLDVPPTLPLHPELMLWRGDPWCVVLWGPTGTGKTWAAVRLLGEIYVQTGRCGRFVDALGVVTAVRALREQFQESGYVEDLVTRPFLLLDDVTNVKLDARDSTSRTALNVLTYILRERDAWKRPTIVTANLSLKVWASQDSQMLAPVASRLAVGLVRELSGEDRRMAKPAAQTRDVPGKTAGLSGRDRRTNGGQGPQKGSP